MMFRKGAFEVPDCTIYPAAVKYDPRFADPFWNSSRFSLLHFLIRLTTSWGLFCDIHYLPSQKKLPDETSIDFAKRVKRMIAEKGSLLDLDWDGQLKRVPPNPIFKAKVQRDFTEKVLKVTCS